MKARYNVAPSQPVVALRNEAQDAAEEIVWGLIPSWSEPSAKPAAFINARVESVATKASFREPFQTRRAVVFADGYYEWGVLDGQKQPYYITLPEQRAFAFAGLWDEWIDTNGQTLRTCAILTTHAHPSVAGIHHRMPVLVADDRIDAWLDRSNDGETALAAIATDVAAQLCATAVGTGVNFVNRDDPTLIKPIEPVRQEKLF